MNGWLLFIIVWAGLFAYFMTAISLYRKRYPARLKAEIARFRADCPYLSEDTEYLARRIDGDAFWKSGLAATCAFWPITLLLTSFRNSVTSGLPTTADVDPVLLQAEIDKRDREIARLEREAGIR